MFTLNPNKKKICKGDKKMYSKILIPVDGSETSEEASRRGIEVAAKCGSSVHAVYVIDRESFFGKIKTTDPTEMERQWMNTKLEFKREGEKALSAVENMAREKRIPFTKEMLEGKPGSEIIKAVNDRNIDLVVMGSARITNKFLLGSVAENVVRNVACSVLISR